MTRSAQRAAPWPRLLCAVLLLGIVTLHVLGRPAESHAGEDVSAGRSVASGPAPAAGCPAVLDGPALPEPDAPPARTRGTAPLGGAARGTGRSGESPATPAPRAFLTRLSALRI